MPRKIIVAVATALILGLLALLVLFGSALAQPAPRTNGAFSAAEGAACHAQDDATDSASGHMLADIAAALGIGEAELRAALDGGTSLRALAASKGIDQARLEAAVSGAMRAAMQRHVDDGALSRDEADAMLGHVTQMGADHLAGMLDGAGHGDMMGGAGHGDMMGGAGHGDMMGGAGHGDMMGGAGHDMMSGAGHGDMMGGAGHGDMMGGAAPSQGEDTGASCHSESGTVGERT